MLLKIPRLYDSHAHFIATGEFSHGLLLGSIRSAQDLRVIDIQNKRFFRSEFLVGFGLSSSGWMDAQNLDKSLLDEVFPNTPVYFARNDGHGAFVNSLGLAKLGLSENDGILLEKEHLAAWDKLPKYTPQQIDEFVKLACGVFNRAGFTHVRDLSCTEELWNSLIRVADRGDLTLALEENFTVHYSNEFDETLKIAVQCSRQQHRLVKAKGIKIFYDGSLGAETAYLSQDYLTTPGNRGRVLWSLSDVEEMLIKTWSEKLEFSIHTIGDQAAHEIVDLARRVSAKGFVGRLNLEHGQILRPETIQMMKPLHVRVHMQPCHWLSDRKWLQDKIGDLMKDAFPWRALEAANIPVSYGCDSPVEPTSFLKNLEALTLSAKERIRPTKGTIADFHSHPDKGFADSYTVFEDNILKEIVFEGQSLPLFT